MFTDRFIQTVQSKNLTAYKIAKDTGISQGLMNEYKNGVKLLSLIHIQMCIRDSDCTFHNCSPPVVMLFSGKFVLVPEYYLTAAVCGKMELPMRCV